MSLIPPLRRKNRARVDEVRVATPCSARWEDMEGDDKVRFCEACRLPVYNLSAMDVEEAAERICGAQDRLCVRFYRRADGTVLTQECPVGVENARERRRHVVRGVAATVIAAGFAGTLLTPTMGAVARPAARIASLQSAAKAGDVARLQAMLDAGIDPDSRRGSGKTPLMFAAELGQVDAVRLLLDRGADPNLKARGGITALQLASAAERQGVVRLLRGAGAIE